MRVMEKARDAKMVVFFLLAEDALHAGASAAGPKRLGHSGAESRVNAFYP